MSAKSVLLEPQHLLDPTLEHTLIVVKPDGYARGLTGEILRRIEAKGYTIKGLKLTVASRWPSTIMATTGPEFMNSRRPSKKGLSLWSA